MPSIKYKKKTYAGATFPVLEMTKAEYNALSEAKKMDGTVYLITDDDGGWEADRSVYDNTDSGLTATNVQDALDEITSTVSSNYNNLNSSKFDKTGGTVSGGITYKDSTIDLTKADNNVSSTTWPTTADYRDKNNNIMARLEAVIAPSGNVGSFWYCRNYDAQGAVVAQKGISMTMDKSGNFTYSVNDPAKFISAIGAASYTAGNWTPKLYDYETYLRDLPSQSYVKLGPLYVMFINTENINYSGINTMIQFRNLPCSNCFGGSMYIAALKATSFSAGTGVMIQGSGNRIYPRGNIKTSDINNPTASGITQGIFFGY